MTHRSTERKVRTLLLKLRRLIVVCTGENATQNSLVGEQDNDDKVVAKYRSMVRLNDRILLTENYLN